MSMQYVRDTYGVPAKRGMRVEAYYRDVIGEWVLAFDGRITSASHYVHVDGIPFHPTAGMVYFDKDGAVLFDGRKAT